jgi:flagellin
MVSGTTLNTTAFRVANFYQTNDTFLANAMKKVASGKRLQNPKDNIPDFFRAQKLRQTTQNLNRIGNGIDEGIATLQVAEKAGTMVFEDLNRMRELVDLYWDNSPSNEEKIAMQAEFDSLAQHVTALKSGTYYNDIQVMQSATPLARITIDTENRADTFDLTFDPGEIADTALLDITGPDKTTVANAVQVELDKAGLYLGQASGYTISLWAQRSLTENQSNAYTGLEKQISDTDQAKEMHNVITGQIRQQASLAMLSQANMFSQNILSLFR